eukprot:914586-Rhodomonas_salina.1
MMGSGTPDQLDQIVKALDGLNKRFDTLDARFDALNTSVNERFDAVDCRTRPRSSCRCPESSLVER